METWKVGDFFQYHYWRSLTKREKEKIVTEGTGIVRDGKLVAPIMTKGAFMSKHPIIQAGEIEVYTSCRNKTCGTWLEALAVIKKGRFVEITTISSRKLDRIKSVNQKRKRKDTARDSWGSKDAKMIAHKKVIGR